MDWTVQEWVVGGFVVASAVLFWVGIVGLLRPLLRRVVKQIGRWLGLLTLVTLMATMVPGQADADSEVRRLCSQRAAGTRVLEALGDTVGIDVGQYGSWRLWSLELCATMEFETVDGDAGTLQALSPATIEFRTAPGAALFWDADGCSTWQYRRKKDSLIAVVGKCRVKLNLLPLGSKFNVAIWTKDIYQTFLVGPGGYQDYPLPYWIDPYHERALDYRPGPDEENAALGKVTNGDRERIENEH